MPNLWSLIERVGSLLEANERHSVLGDIAERGADARALLDLIGLVLLRQAQSWLTWRPWLLTAALAVPISFAGSATHPLALIAHSGHLLSFGSGSGTFLVQPWIALAAPAYAWAAGFALGKLGNRRTATVLLLLIAISGFASNATANRIFEIALPPLWKTMFQIVPTVGQQLSNSIRMLSDSLRFGVALAVMILAVALPSVHGWYRGQQGKPAPFVLGLAILATALWTEGSLLFFTRRSSAWFLLSSWPLAYIAFISVYQRLSLLFAPHPVSSNPVRKTPC